jgi:uncharacterized Zn finger protein (UPF0148 family)
MVMATNKLGRCLTCGVYSVAVLKDGAIRCAICGTIHLQLLTTKKD